MTLIQVQNDLTTLQSNIAAAKTALTGATTALNSAGTALATLATDLTAYLATLGTTPPPVTTPGPLITKVTASAIGQNGATISWTLNEPATGQVRYGPTAAYGSLSPAETSFSYSAHEQTLAGLSADTTYHYSVSSTDQAGNTSTSPDATFRTTAASGGTVPPPVGTGGTIALSPSKPTALVPGSKLQLAAVVSGLANAAVSWAVDGIANGNSTIGTISAAGLYAAPTVGLITVHRITATSVANPALSASLRILITVGTSLLLAINNGAVGSGSVDDTKAINATMAKVANGICRLTPGTFLINPIANGTCGLDIPDGVTLLLDPGAILQCKTQTTKGDYRIVRIMGSHSALVGGAIIGDRAARSDIGNHNLGHDDGYVEVGDGIGVNGANGGANNFIGGVDVGECCDDGILVYNGVNGLSMFDVVSNHNRRQGMSIIQANGLTALNCTFSNTQGQDPGAGVDIEPAGSGQICTAIQLLSCKVFGNKGGGVLGGSNYASVNHVTIDDADIYGNGGQDYGCGGLYFNDGASFLTLTNSRIHDNVAGGHQGGVVLSGTSDNTVSSNVISKNAGHPVSVTSSPRTTVSKNTGTGNTQPAILNDGSATLSGNTFS